MIDTNDQPRITDFGLARHLDSDSDLTLSGEPLGTPGFMPPEQVTMTRGSVGPWSDIYSLGGVLYQLLTSRAPFVAGSIPQLFHQILHADPVSPRLLNAAVPRDLETLCLKALSKQPERRFSSALEFAEELDRFTHNEPIHSRPTSLTERCWRLCQRYPTSAGIAIFSVAALVIAFIAVASSAQTARNASAHVARVLRRTELGLADQELEGGKPLLGISSLARLVREDPRDPVAVSRLVSALDHRSYAVPIGERLHPNEVVWSADISRDETTLVTTCNSNEVYVWSLGGSSKSGLRDTAGPHSKFPNLAQKLPHPAPVFLVRFNPDHSRVLTVSKDRRIRLWSTDTGGSVAVLEESPGDLLSACFSPDGALIASLGEDGRLRLYHSSNGELISDAALLPEEISEGRELSVLVSKIHDQQPISFSPDSRSILTVGIGNEASVWDVASGKRRLKLAHGGLVTTGCFSPDGRRVVTAGSDKTLKIWDSWTGELLTQPTWVATGSNQSVFSEDGRRVASAFYDGTVRIWDVASGAQVAPPLVHKHYIVQDEAFSPDGMRLLTASHDGTARIWEVSSGLPITSPIPGGTSLRSGRFLAHGQEFATRGSGGWQLWQLVGRSGPVQTIATGADIGCIQLGSDGLTLAVVDVSLCARFLDLRTTQLSAKVSDAPGLLMGTSPTWRGMDGRSAAAFALWEHEHHREVKDLVKPGEQLRSFACSADGRWLALGFASGRAAIHTITGELVKGLNPGMGTSIDGIQFSPAGNKVAFIAGSAACLVDVSSAEQTPVLLKHPEPLLGLQISRDERWLVSWGQFQNASLWNLRAPGSQPTLLGSETEVGDARFDLTGTRVVTASTDETVRVWDLALGRQVCPPMQHGAGVRAVRITPDNRLIISVAVDGKARVWDMETGLAMTEPLWCGGILSTLEVTPDGERFVAAGTAGKIYVWPIPHPTLPADAWLPDLAEALAGIRKTGEGAHERLPANSMSKMMERLRLDTNRSSLRDWAQRHFSPNSSKAEAR